MSDPDLSAELRQALQEQSFGIQTYEVISDPFEHAIIKLLEGPSIKVKVTTQGWEVVEATTVVYPYTAPATSRQRYETLDNLLRSNSSEYAAKESQKLQDKLYALFEQQRRYQDQFERHLEQSMLFGTPKPKRNALMRRAKKWANRTLHCGSPPSSPEPYFQPTVQYRASVAVPNTTIVVQNSAGTPYVPSVHLPPANVIPAPSTTATSFVQLPVVPPVEHHAEYMPTPLPIIPTYRASPTAKPANPWASDDYDNVLDGKHLPTALADISINIHPKMSASAEPFPLIVDLRLSRSRIWKRPKPGYDETPELWKGHDESATLPKLNFMILLCPLFDAPIRVESDEGITCGDVINALFGLAQAPISDERWKALPYLEKQQARSLAPSMRGLALAWSVLDPHSFVYLDTWHGQVTFAGLRRDPQYVKKRMGWANPVCFVVELARPVHGFRYE